MRKEGERLILEPAKKTAASLSALLATLEPIDEEIGPIDDLPLRKVRF
jgi:antitoxin VapB